MVPSLLVMELQGSTSLDAGTDGAGPPQVSQLCQSCILGLLKEESASAYGGLVTSLKEELISTFQTFRSVLAEVKSPQLQQVSVAPSTMVTILPGKGEYEAGSGYSLPMTGSSDEEDPLEGTFTGSSRFKLTLEEVDELHVAIYDILDIKEEKVEFSKHDLMY